MELLGATATHVGNVRENNQDRAHFGGYVGVVADGMGGHQGGETAAAIAISEFIEVTAPIGPTGLVELVEEANRAVFERAADPDLRGMGTTLVALTLRPAEEKVSVVNVGDSRAYYLRGDEFGQLTHDHSLVEDLVRQNRLTPDEALNHPQRNILTRALGIASHVEVDRFLIPTKVGDRFLLCSDGLFNEVSVDHIKSLLQQHTAPNAAADALVAAALSGAGRDNITVVVVDVVADGEGGNLSTTMSDTQLLPAVTPASGVSPEVVPSGRGHRVKAASNGLSAPRAGGAIGLDEVTGHVGHAASPETVSLQPGASHPAPAHRVPNDVPAPTEGVALDPQREISVDPNTDPTAELVAFEPHFREPEPGGRRWVLRSGLALAALGLLAVAGFFGARWYNQSIYYVGLNNDQVAVFHGRPGGVVVADPVVVDEPGPKVDELTPESQDKVKQQQRFGSEAEAREFVMTLEPAEMPETAEILKGIDSTTTTVTLAPATVAPATVAPTTTVASAAGVTTVAPGVTVAAIPPSAAGY